METKVPGIYFFDFIRAQEENPERSSKDALLVFLSETPFMEVRIRCAHVPPWIERDGRFEVQVQDKGEEVIALIRKIQCERKASV